VRTHELSGITPKGSMKASPVRLMIRIAAQQESQLSTLYHPAPSGAASRAVQCRQYGYGAVNVCSIGSHADDQATACKTSPNQPECKHISTVGATMQREFRGDL